MAGPGQFRIETTAALAIDQFLLGVEEVIEASNEKGHCAEGEVQDARGGIGDDQPR